MSTCEPGEPLTLLYSSPEVPQHFGIHSCDNLQGTTQENNEERSSRIEGQLSDVCTAKGYNAIFYRTVQYLRLVFPQKRRNNEMKNIDLHADQVEHHERKETSSIADPRQGNDQGIEDNRNKLCVRGIRDTTLSFKQGELIAIVGKHGAGKTTLLKILSGRLICWCEQVSLH